MNPRIQHFLKKLHDKKLDGYLLTQDVNIQYLTGFPASESWLLVSPKKLFYITDSRYTLEARQGVQGIKVEQYTTSIFATFFGLLKKVRATRLGFDDRQVSLAFYKQLTQECPKRIRLVSCPGLVEELREIKEREEVAAIRSCLKLHHQGYAYLKGVIKPGLTEKTVLWRLEQFVKSRNAGFSFSPIIAAGPNSCYPHAKVTDRKIRNNEPVLVDFGIELGGYKSDLTRMFFLGKIPPLVKKVNDAVAVAQNRAIAAIKPGARACDVDSQARNFLKEKGLAKYFGHSLGHGVGLEIHEAPRLSTANTGVLKPGMVVTVEPAVYLPQQFGIRIEDMALVTPSGCELLSR